jgi:Peptidase propeptide and YPEB domain
MKMRFSYLALLLVAALVTAVGAAAPFAQALPPAPTDEGQKPIYLTASMSMDQAVKMAEQRFKARVVRAEAQHDGDHTVYVLRMLNESGRVWTVRVDASNGAVL